MRHHRKGHALPRRYGHSRAPGLTWSLVYSSPNFKRWRAARAGGTNESYDIGYYKGEFELEFADSQGDLHRLGKFATLADAKEAAKRHNAARARFE